jgi:hypothetical protein
VVRTLFEAVREAAGHAEFVERLRPLGYTVLTSASPAALAARIRDETPRWESLVRASGARLD